MSSGARAGERREREGAEHPQGVRLRLGDVGLVEGIDRQGVAGDGHGQLETEELRSKCPRLGDRDVDDMPVVTALGIGGGHGHAAAALLAGRLGDQLLDPQPEGTGLLAHDDGGLVAPGERLRAHLLAERDGLLPVGVESALAQLRRRRSP